jgi:exosortase/archaeosortase
LDRSSSISNSTVSHPISIFSAHAALLVYNAIKAAQTVDQKAVADSLRRATTDTFVGKFSFDTFNAQQLTGTLNQIVNDSLFAISPLSVQEVELIVPMPTWSQRTMEKNWTAVEIAAIVILSLSLINTIYWAAWVVMNRTDKTVIASAPVFLGGMLMGSVFIYIAMFLSIPMFLTTGLCGARVWILALGTTLLMGSMLAKTWCDSSDLRLFLRETNFDP